MGDNREPDPNPVRPTERLNESGVDVGLDTIDEFSAGHLPREVAESVPARPRLARNLAALMTSQVITWSLALVITIVLPRFIGPSILGQLRLAGAVWAIGSLFVGLGMSTFLTIEMSRDETRGRLLVGRIIVIRAIAWIAVSACIALFVIARETTTELTILLVLGGIGALFGTVADVYAAALAGLEQMTPLARAAVVSKLAYSAILLLVLFLGGDIYAVAICGLLPAIGYTMLVMRSYGRFGRTVLAGWRASATVVVRSSAVFLVAGATLVVYQQVDTIVMGALVDPAALGWYTTADGLFSSLLFVPAIVMASVLPRFSRLHLEDPSSLDHLVRRTFSSLALLGVPIGLGTVVVADQFTLLLLGEEYQQAGPVLRVYGIVIVFVFGTILFGGLATATGRQRFWTILMIGAILISIPLDIVLVPWTDSRFGNGAIGGALAYVVTESIMFAVGIWKIAPCVRQRASMVRLAKVVLSGAVMFSATWPLRDMFFMLPVLVGVVVYVFMILITRVLDEPERVILRSARARLTRTNSVA